MKPKIPLGHFITDAQAFFVVRKLENADLIGEDLEDFLKLKKLWDEFMKGPDHLTGLNLSIQFYPKFRRLEALARDVLKVGDTKFPLAIRKRGRPTLPDNLSLLPRSPSEARTLGLKIYYPGKPCALGHEAARYLSGSCKACVRERVRKQRNVEGMAMA